MEKVPETWNGMSRSTQRKTNGGQILWCEVIQKWVWNDESYSNMITVRIRQLRQKMDDGQAVHLIHTVYGQGFGRRAPEPKEDRPTG